jgi:hypothetical protein
MAHVFISYVREDQHEVDRMCADLHSAGVHTWLDRDQIKPGQRWRRAIRDAIRTGAFFVACFSSSSVARSKTYMNEELTLAIDELRQMPAERTWFIPVLLSRCEVPDTPIGGGETLRDLQWISFKSGWKSAIEELLDAIGSAQSNTAEEDGSPAPEQRNVVMRDRVDIVRHTEFRFVDLDDGLLLEFELNHEDRMEDIDVLVLNLRFYYSNGTIGQFPVPVLGTFEGTTFRQVVARAVKQYEKHSKWAQCKGYKKSWDRQWLDFLRRRDDSIQLELADGQRVDLPWSEKVDAYVIAECYSSDDWVYEGINIHI